jgi:beta-glucosidase/6-phospho-beta-glucosidase/beta-galactosidase
MMVYAKTFGIVAVNRETQERVVKPSARYVGEIAWNNAFNSCG